MTSLQKKVTKGQGLLETILVLPVALAFIVLLFYTSYRAMIYFYADHVLHEAMICTDADSLSSCEIEFQNQIRPLMLRNEQVQIQLSKSGFLKTARVNGEIQIKSNVQNFGFSFLRILNAGIHIKKQMSFPLKGFR
ncbi:hypothetical protein ACLVWU_15980 [Bdellovibrio sp. HCB290]|uniref:hypothetical protein n=1 Tax=Bdellovibrio sp. HCB290 TaxID=3394356 RepID=UPI0039B4B444